MKEKEDEEEDNHNKYVCFVLVIIAIVTTVFVKNGEVKPVHHKDKHKQESGGTVQLINLSSV
jgi:hypothetical protein